MATPSTIEVIEEYIQRKVWGEFTRNADGSHVITGIPAKGTLNAQYNLYTVKFNLYLTGPDKQGKFEVVDVEKGGLPASYEFPIPLSVGVQQLTGKGLQRLLNPDQFDIGFGSNQPSDDKQK